MWIRSLRAVFCASSDENALLASAFEEHRVRLKLVSVVGKEVIELIHEEIDNSETYFLEIYDDIYYIALS